MMAAIKSDLDHLERLAADFHSDGHAQTAVDFRRAVKDIQNLRDYASQLERSIHRMTVVDADHVDLLMDAGFVGDELFHPHEVVALMQKAFDQGWDQTGVAATSLHQDFPNMHNHNRDKHVVRFLKEAMAENE